MSESIPYRPLPPITTIDRKPTAQPTIPVRFCGMAMPYEGPKETCGEPAVSWWYVAEGYKARVPVCQSHAIQLARIGKRIVEIQPNPAP